MTSASASPIARPDETALRATIEQLAKLERLPCSPGEHDAAYIIADRLRDLGCPARVEEEPAYGSYAWPVGAMTGLATVSGLLAGTGRGRERGRARGRRLAGVLGGALATAGLADEISYGSQFARKVLSPRRTAYN